MSTSDPGKKRVHPRLKNYDYSLPGAYFITICTNKRRKLFGEICVGRDLCVPPSPARVIAEKWIRQIERKFPTCKVDHAAVMPNHVHLLLTLEPKAGHTGPALRDGTITVPGIIQWYKTMTANDYIRAVKDGLLPPFETTIWQRSFYDHVIRGEEDYLRIWRYIDENPARWAEDEYYSE